MAHPQTPVTSSPPPSRKFSPCRLPVLKLLPKQPFQTLLPIQEKALKGKEKAAAPAPTTDADVKKQEEKNKEKEEAEKWIQNYTLKQRDEKLLKTIDPEYIEIMRVFREQQEFEGHVRRRAEEAAGVTAEETTT